MARLNTSLDDEPPPPPQRPTETAAGPSRTQHGDKASKTLSRAPQKKKKPVVVIDLSSSPPSPPAGRRNGSPPPSSPEPQRPRGRRRLVRKKFVWVGSEEEEEGGEARDVWGVWGGEGEGGEEDSDTAVNSRRPAATNSPSLQLRSVSRNLLPQPAAIAHKGQRLTPRSPHPRQPPRAYYSNHVLSDGEAAEVPLSELSLSPPPSPEGSGDSIPSHSTRGEDDDDEYDSSFVVGDSTVEYESEAEGGDGEADILDLVDGFGEVGFAEDRGRRVEERGMTVGEREIERGLSWFREVRRRRREEEERRAGKEVYGAGLGVRGRGHEEEEGEGEGEDEDEDEGEDEDSGSGGNICRDLSTDRGAILSYIPPTTKPLVRARTPLSIPSSPIARPLPTTNKKKPLHLPAHVPPSTPARNPKVLLPPTKAITLTPAATYSDPDPSTHRTPAALKSFRSRKQALADQFLLELDFRVTSNRVYQKLSHLGGLKVVWSKNLLKTAGYFKYRYKRSARVDEDGEHLPGEHRIITFAQIELAEKVVDDEHRLYSTLAHEFAHAANAVVGENWDQRCHGKGFKQWLLKCQKAFPERAIELGSCHNYVISYKYQWACIGRWANADGTWGVEDGCGYVVKRHSRSVDVEIHRCPTCVGRLMQTLPKPVGGGGGVAVAEGQGGQSNGAPQGLTEYQAFMQERMKVVRRDNPGMPQKEVMRLVGLEWRGKKERGEVGLGKSDGKEKGREKEKGRARMEVIEISDDDGDNMGVGLTDRLDGLRI